MDKTRFEAFSDGVFAIAITLLVLDLKVPTHSPGGLWSALGEEWPQFAAFVVSFAIIGIIWMNHHSLVASMKSVDRPTLLANLFVLFTAALIPFPTSLMASVIREGGRDAHVAAAIYSAACELMAISMAIMWQVIHRNNGKLLIQQPTAEEARRERVRFAAGHIPYIAGIGIAFINPYATLIIIAIVAIYYAFEQVNVAS